jgi:tetratricopeptide (TPR) repeat protein
MSRPSGGMSRPSGGMSRPSGGMSRPSGGMSRPSGGMNRPNTGGGNRPNMGGGGRPNMGGGNIAHNANRPNFNPGTRPGQGGVQRPGIGEGNRPGIGSGNRPGIGQGNRPNVPNRPGDGIANRPSRPGQGGGGIQRPDNRPNWNNNNRPNWDNRTGLRPDNNTNINNFINNHNNFAVGNGNRWNDWHHGYWGNGQIDHPGYWGYRAGYNRGYWNGFNNASWYRPWYGAAAAWGLGAWALGSVWYDSGYSYYSNPYYDSGAGYYDYSQPIQVVTPPAQVTVVDNSTDTTSVTTADSSQSATPPPPSPEQEASRTHLDKAQDAFMAGNYDEAGKETDLAIKETPNDTALHEYRALVDFAAGDYNRAAGTLYAVLSAGPGWDWTTLSSQYKSVKTYTEQLRKLEQHVKSNPDDTAGHFVLAYQYITATHKEAAINQLKQVVELQPKDQLSAQLIKGLGGDVPKADGDSPPPAEIDGPSSETPPPDIDPKKILGEHVAKRDDGSTFQLDLTADDKFTWTFEQNGKKQSFDGTYKVDGAILVLERADKATMPGLVTMEDGGFNFKLFGGPDSDPGLDFKS